MANEAWFPWNPAMEAPANASDLLAQIGPDGNFRTQLTTMLATARVSAGAYDDAVEAGQLTWHDWGWGILTQTVVDDYIVYIGFRRDNGQPADAAVIRDPVAPAPEVQYVFVNSPEARDFRAAGEFARCGQQAANDLATETGNAAFGVGPVDGAPGNGSRRGLAAIADHFGITVPHWNRETAAQICYLLTAQAERFADLPGGSLIGYPGALFASWNGQEGGLYDFQGISTGVRLAGDAIVQIGTINFGPGIRAFENGQERISPYPLTGTVVTHGTDDPRAEALLQLVQNDTVGMLEGVVTSQGSWFPGIGRELGGGLPGEPDNPPRGEVLWTVIANLDGADVVVADILLDRDLPQDRVVIIFADGESDDDQLLYGWFSKPSGANPIIPNDMLIGGSN